MSPFQTILGEKYRQCNPPEEIEKTEFENLLKMCESVDDRLDISLLKACYKEDENVNPPCYVLQKPEDQDGELKLQTVG